MKKKLILLLVFILLLTSCKKIDDVSKEPAQNIDILENLNLKTLTGILQERYIENDIRYIDIENDDGIHKIEANDYPSFEMLKANSKLTVLYDSETNKLIDILEEILPEDINKEVIEANKATENNEEKIIIELEESINLDGLNEYGTLDLSGFEDVPIEKVSIYTDAELDPDGYFMFDDMNRFLVICHSENGDHLLLDKNLQLSSVNVQAFTADDSLNIGIFEHGSANISFSIFEYVDGNFEKNVKYQGEGNINLLGTI